MITEKVQKFRIYSEFNIDGKEVKRYINRVFDDYESAELAYDGISELQNYASSGMRFKIESYYE